VRRRKEEIKINTEYSLIQLLLREPHKTVDLQRKGIRAKYFKNKKLGKAYKLIYDRHTNLQSLPTEEELTRLDVKLESEEIPHTVNHLIENILEEYNKNFMKDVIRASSEAVTEHGPNAARDILLKGVQLLADIEKSERSKNIVDINEEVMQRYLDRAQHKGQITGIPTGFHIFDNHTMGLQPQWLVCIAGRNASFKTWVLTNWALNAWRRGNNVLVFSCEMSVPELAIRVHALAANVPPTKVQHGILDDIELDRFTNHLEAAKSAPFGKLIINDDPKSIADIDDQIAEISQDVAPDIIFIDSAYLMEGKGESDTSRQRDIAKQAKLLAKKYNIPVVCTVQLNRDFAKANAGKEKTTGGGYFVSGTDGWNQDSDIVLMLNRPEVYQAYDYSDFILDKFRHGPQGVNYILEINLQVPKIEQIDFETAKARIVGAPPPSTQKGQKVFDMAKQVFQTNESAVANDVLQTFKEHQERLKTRSENQIVDDKNNERPSEEA